MLNNIFQKKIVKYFLIGLIFLWVSLSIHIFYLFVIYSSQAIPSKGGTLVEGSREQIGLMPYLSQSKKDKFYQSLLFRSCLKEERGEQGLKWSSDLCSVDTRDSKNYTVSLKDQDGVWSDGQRISLDDIYFTFNSLLRENIFHIPELGLYSKIVVEKTSDNKIVVQFPFASVDNILIFSQPILPAHVLSGKILEDYISQFSQKPISSYCADLETLDTQNIVFNLDKCPRTLVKYFQVKKFSDFSAFQQYALNATNNIVDYYVSNNTTDGYKDYKIPTSTYIGMFFNQESVDVFKRRKIIGMMAENLYTGMVEGLLLKDHFLFDVFSYNKNDIFQWGGEGKVVLPKTTQLLPQTIVIESTTKSFTYALPQDQKFSLNFQFDKHYDKYTIRHNNTDEFVLKTVNKSKKTAQYNVAPNYSNVIDGINVYELNVYEKDKVVKNVVVKMIPNYGPTSSTGSTGSNGMFRVAYLADPLTTSIANTMKMIPIMGGSADVFELVPLNDSKEFERTILSKNYDILLYGLDLGYKKDISTMFYSNELKVNPSMYKNADFAGYINQYFIAEEKIKPTLKSDIDAIYTQDVPFMILGRTYHTLNVKEKNVDVDSISFTPLFRNELLQNSFLTSRVILDKKKILNIGLFLNFITSKL